MDGGQTNLEAQIEIDCHALAKNTGIFGAEQLTRVTELNAYDKPERNAELCQPIR